MHLGASSRNIQRQEAAFRIATNDDDAIFPVIVRAIESRKRLKVLGWSFQGQNRSPGPAPVATITALGETLPIVFKSTKESR
jgi:hypothetical protein